MFWKNLKTKNKTEIHTWNEYQIHIQRKAFYRGIRLKIKEPGQLHITSSQTLELKQVLSFLNEQKAWIAKHQDKLKQRLANKAESIRLYDQQIVMFLGKELVLRLKQIDAGRHRIELKNSNKDQEFGRQELWIYAKNLSETDLQLYLQNYYKEQAQIFLPILVEKISQKLDYPLSKLSLRLSKTRWGSCNSKGNISLNWALMLFPVSVIEYVIVHELCHLKHMNHSKSFWQLVAKHCPNYKDEVRRLKADAHKTAFLFKSK